MAAVFAVVIISSAVVSSAIIVVIIARVFHVHIATSETFYRVMVTIPVRPFTTFRERSAITTLRIIATVNVPAEMIVAVIPRSRTDKGAVRKPLRPVIPVRGALVRRLIVVSIWAHGLLTDLNADAYLRLCLCSEAQKAESHNCRSREIPEFVHGLSPLSL
jgi:hypothetical protein